LLRLVPVLVDRAQGNGPSPRWRRGLEAAGLATIGSLLALAVFEPPAAPVQVGLRLGALLLAFGLFLWLRCGLLCLLLAYGAYVLAVLTV
jgi:hypothetical protein